MRENVSTVLEIPGKFPVYLHTFCTATDVLDRRWPSKCDYHGVSSDQGSCSNRRDTGSRIDVDNGEKSNGKIVSHIKRSRKMFLDFRSGNEFSGESLTQEILEECD